MAGKLIGRLAFPVKTVFHLGNISLLRPTSLLAFFQSFKIIFISSATTVDELLTLTAGLIKVVSRKVSSAVSCLRWKGTYTRLFAFFQCFEIISISTATTKGESFAATFGLIEIKSRETCSAKSCHFWKETIAHTLRGHQIQIQEEQQSN